MINARIGVRRKYHISVRCSGGTEPITVLSVPVAQSL